MRIRRVCFRWAEPETLHHAVCTRCLVHSSPAACSPHLVDLCGLHTICRQLYTHTVSSQQGLSTEMTTESTNNFQTQVLPLFTDSTWYNYAKTNRTERKCIRFILYDVLVSQFTISFWNACKLVEKLSSEIGHSPYSQLLDLRDLDLGLGHMAYHRVPLTDLNLHTKSFCGRTDG